MKLVKITGKIGYFDNQLFFFGINSILRDIEKFPCPVFHGDVANGHKIKAEEQIHPRQHEA